MQFFELTPDRIIMLEICYTVLSWQWYFHVNLDSWPFTSTPFQRFSCYPNSWPFTFDVQYFVSKAGCSYQLNQFSVLNWLVNIKFQSTTHAEKKILPTLQELTTIRLTIYRKLKCLHKVSCSAMCPLSLSFYRFLYTELWVVCRSQGQRPAGHVTNHSSLCSEACNWKNKVSLAIFFRQEFSENNRFKVHLVGWNL